MVSVECWAPTISAWLSRPADKFSFLNFELLRHFPYLLPSIVCFLLAMFAMSISYIFIRETLSHSLSHKLENFSENELEVSDYGNPNRSYNNKPKSKQLCNCNTLCKLLSQRLVLSAILNYNYFAFINIEFEELIPLMLVTAPGYGGFCMNENSLGLISLSTSTLQIPWALIVLPIIIGYLGIRKSIRYLLLFYTIIVFLIPFWTSNTLVTNSFAMIIANNITTTTTTTTTSYTSCESINLGITSIPVKVWVVLLTLLIPLYLLRMALFTCYTIGVANSSKRDMRATVNGLSQSGAALLRLIGPIFSANIFAWSISSKYSWPIDYKLIWMIGCVQLSLLFAASFLFPAKIEHTQD